MRGGCTTAFSWLFRPLSSLAAVPRPGGPQGSQCDTERLESKAEPAGWLRQPLRTGTNKAAFWPHDQLIEVPRKMQSLAAAFSAAAVSTGSVLWNFAMANQW